MMSGGRAEEPSQRRLEHDIRDMISNLSRHLTSLGRPTARPRPATGQEDGEEGDQGVRIITLAGDNKGATMRAERLGEAVDTHGVLYSDERTMRAFTNSNYQAVNNSIVFEGSCTAEDPGVHVVISEYLEDDHDVEKHGKKEKEKKKGKEEERQLEAEREDERISN